MKVYQKPEMVFINIDPATAFANNYNKCYQWNASFNVETPATEGCAPCTDNTGTAGGYDPSYCWLQQNG